MIKTDVRGSLHMDTVEDLIRIRLEGTSLEEFDVKSGAPRCCAGAPVMFRKENECYEWKSKAGALDNIQTFFQFNCICIAPIHNIHSQYSSIIVQVHPFKKQLT